MNLFDRFKNYGLWVSVASLVLLLLQNFGVNIVEAQYNEIVSSLLSVLVLLGLVNNPTTESKWFKDDTDIHASCTSDKCTSDKPE